MNVPVCNHGPDCSLPNCNYSHPAGNSHPGRYPGYDPYSNQYPAAAQWMMFPEAGQFPIYPNSHQVPPYAFTQPALLNNLPPAQQTPHMIPPQNFTAPHYQAPVYAESSFDQFNPNELDEFYDEDEEDDEESTLRDTWFPTAADCSCCRGFIYNCTSETCDMLGICGCTFDSNQDPQPDQPQAPRSENPVEDAAPPEPFTLQKLTSNNFDKEIGGLISGLSEETFGETLKLVVELVLSNPANIAVWVRFVIKIFTLDWIKSQVQTALKFKTDMVSEVEKASESLSADSGDQTIQEKRRALISFIEKLISSPNFFSNRLLCQIIDSWLAPDSAGPDSILAACKTLRAVGPTLDMGAFDRLDKHFALLEAHAKKIAQVKPTIDDLIALRKNDWKK